MRWVIFVLGVLPLFSYGVLNVVAPRATIAWQIRSTARRGENDPRRRVGTAGSESVRPDSWSRSEPCRVASDTNTRLGRDGGGDRIRRCSCRYRIASAYLPIGTRHFESRSGSMRSCRTIEASTLRLAFGLIFVAPHVGSRRPS